MNIVNWVLRVIRAPFFLAFSLFLLPWFVLAAVFSARGEILRDFCVGLWEVLWHDASIDF